MGRARPRFLISMLLGIFLQVAGWAVTGVSPSAEDREALEGLKGKTVGQIVWESNRDGNWNLYTMNADGTGARRLTSWPDDETDACLSPDGRRLVFTRKRAKDSAVWIMSSDGTGAEVLIEDASSPEWFKSGRTIQFSRQPDRRKEHYETWEYDCATEEQRKLFPPEGVKFEAEIRLARANDAATRFVGWSPRPRGTWVWSPDGQLQKRVHGGCEGQVAADQRYGYGVHETGNLVRFNLSDGENMFPMLARSALQETWDHTYFPGVSRNSQWLIYGACPHDQHDHDTSDYEIFIVRLADWKQAGEPVRLTFNKRTDRWPNIYLAPAGSRHALPDGAYDVAGNALTNTVAPLAIFTFPTKDAKPDFGGDWGLWPQVEGCRGDAQFVAEDAEGGKGGSIRIDYSIARAPKSFSMWMAPGGPVDLSGYDRIALYAKGSAPSFTIVVKDGNAGDPDAPDGIADCVVTGVTGTWQRFELRLSDFVPRKPGARVDWGTIDHFGIAMIAPQNAEQGTLEIDNIIALPKGG